MKAYKASFIGLSVVALVFLTVLSGMAAQGKHAHARTAAQPKAKITAKQAESTVLEKYPGTITEKTKLENEEGKWQYGIMVKSGKTLREVMVDAKTGKIASEEVTNASTEKKEAAAETTKTKAPSTHAQKHPVKAKPAVK